MNSSLVGILYFLSLLWKVPFFGFTLVKVRGMQFPCTFTSGLIAHHLSSFDIT